MGLESINYPFNNINFGAYNAGASKSSRSETFEEYKNRIEREKQEQVQKQEETKRLREEYNAALSKIDNDKTLKAGKKVLREAENAKVQQDGSLKHKETMSEYKKLPFWKKATRALGNIVQGTFKMATDFIGMEKDKKTGKYKWNPGKCALNLGITAATIGLCVLFPPAIPYVVGIGAALSGVQTIFGVVKTCIADKPQEIDEGFQDIGAGLTGIALSCVGARGCVKTLPKMPSSASVSNIFASSGKAAAAAKPKLSWGAIKAFLTKNEYAKGSRWTQDIKNLCINMPRAAAQSWKQYKASINDSGFWNVTKNNFAKALPKFGRAKFLDAKKKVHKDILEELSSIDKRMNEIGSIDNTTPAEIREEATLLRIMKKHLLREQKEIFSAKTRKEFNSIISKSRAKDEYLFWDNLQNAAKKSKNNEIVINGHKFNVKNHKDIIEAAKILKESAKNRESLVQNMCRAKRSLMQGMALNNKYASEVDAYTGNTRTNAFMRLYDTTPKLTFGTAFHGLNNILMYQFLPWQYMSKTGGGPAFISLQAIQSMANKGYYEEDMIAEMSSAFGNHLWGDKVLTTDVPVMNAQNQPQYDSKGQLITQKTPLTSELRAQLESHVKEADNSRAAIKKKLDELG